MRGVEKFEMMAAKREGLEEGYFGVAIVADGMIVLIAVVIIATTLFTGANRNGV